MRTNEPEPEPWRPLGEKVTPPAPAPRQPVYQPLEHDKRIERGPDGRLRTNLPLGGGR